MIFLKYLFIFCLFSVVGWILEFGFRSITTKKIVNPGFMSGCVVPLYGFGVVILNLLCNLFVRVETNYKIIVIFILSVILLSVLECVTGYILLKFFNLRLWDYSSSKLNYKGFICAEFSLIWGFLALVFYIFIFPWINEFALKFVNNSICLFFLGIFIGVFLIDLFVSINLFNKFIKYASEMREAINIEKLKLDARMKTKRKKFLNAIYPYVSTNRFLKDKIKK